MENYKGVKFLVRGDNEVFEIISHNNGIIKVDWESNESLPIVYAEAEAVVRFRDNDWMRKENIKH